ncbi:uncharacterized protein LOC107044526 [Diachasma alloeum]|uniref:uncharacterized protein LOC107044526 n=1 Tax=Diachasma alloeum TaxID=454923 RepID=UPI000738277B|nr:uncharacterized protein LOC107044526 [Diachasma alloeum]
MWKLILLISLSIGVSQSQLNFEGNPLTENTDYTAEESHYSLRHDAGKSQKFDETNDNGVDTYLAAANGLTHSDNLPKNIEGGMIDVRSIGPQPQLMNVNKVNQIPRTMTFDVYDNRPVNGYSSASISLNKTKIISRQLSTDPLDTFLNSRTPEESQLALDTYLKSRHQSEIQATRHPQTEVQNIQMINPNNQDNHNNPNILTNAPQYLSNGYTNINTLDNPQNINQAQLPGSAVIPQQNGQIINPQVSQTHPLAPTRPQMTFQSRRDVIPMARRRPFYHHRGVPRYRDRYNAQSRIGPGFISQSPLSEPFGPHAGPPIYPGDKPIDVIYTKPPGFGHRPPPISNSPVPYEAASEYFPESQHPPVNKDVYYSQLWAQSYDPHYYNYIAKTGKIKPWLYGKLGKHEDKGFWHELYISFKKHGMKNMMNPMFLLGLSIPAVTLMLSAMVGKRSLGRSDNDSNYYLSEEKITELAERVQRAIECYENQTACSQ